jgi:two-component system chemotaxis response regulator CheY
MHALVIDDARVVRLLLRGTMQQLGFEVSEAKDGVEGLSRLRQGGTPDVVLVDGHMPQMDGFEFVRQVRRDPRLAGLRVILVTGEEDASVTDRALSDGADACLVKPFTKETLGRRLADLGVCRA